MDLMRGAFPPAKLQIPSEKTLREVLGSEENEMGKKMADCHVNSHLTCQTGICFLNFLTASQTKELQWMHQRRIAQKTLCFSLGEEQILPDQCNSTYIHLNPHTLR